MVEHCSRKHSYVQSGGKTIKPAAQLLGKSRFGGSIMNHHGNQKGDWTACAKVVAGTHQSVLWCFPCHIPASLGQVGCDRPGPPALWGGCSGNCGIKPFGTGGDTHTHTAPLGGARVESLNRHLKSLRNKRKKHRKSSAKRAREKDRSRKRK